ncbi:MAG: hypothetical protein IJC25_00465 [Clostridia bacterium]|nr:hypothetical protein [Clostridia bacterium]
MNSLGQWALSLCVAVIICSLVQLLSPSKRLERALRLACVLLFVLCFIRPLRTLTLPDLSLPGGWQSDYPSPQQSLCSGMELLICSTLQQNGIAAEVTVTADADGRLHALLTVSDPTQCRAALLLVESVYQIETAVTEE